ncbi:hypothetical protein ACFVFH_27865 [Streptomyces sp. NPDC057697]|uniref:hypothetical protein n=1 Tax=Streptomyces sp. NPDC057697 TaxID=3346219 RepID=UPI003681F5BD
MTDEGRTTGRLQDAGRCATCFESFNPACPRAVLDEASQMVPRKVSEPVRPLAPGPRPRTASGPAAPRTSAAPPGPPAPLPGLRGAERPAAAFRDPRRPRTDASAAAAPWQERTAPRVTPGAASPAPGPGSPDRPRTTASGASPTRAPRTGSAAPGRAEAPTTEGGASR